MEFSVFFNNQWRRERPLPSVVAYILQAIPIANKSLSKRLNIKSLFILTGISRTQVEIDPVKFEFHLV